MMRILGSHRQSLLLSAAVFLFFACGDGGCSGCGGCGIAPIPGGYPIEERVPQAAQVRLSESGISFIENNFSDILALFLPSGLDFAVPRTEASVSGFDVTVCTSNDCSVRGELRDVDLAPTPPNRLRGRLEVVLDSRDATGVHRAIPLRIRSGCVLGACVINTTCRADLDTRRGSREFVALQADIALTNETAAARRGYTKVVVGDVSLVDGQDLENADIDLASCSGVSGFFVELFIPVFKTQIVNALESQVSSVLQSTVDDMLCTKPGLHGCPTGTVVVGSGDEAVCRYSAGGECVPQLLGMDGQGDLGAAFLSSFSAGAHAPGQLLLAAGGDGQAVAGGMTLNMHGGFRGTDSSFATSPAHNPCVPIVEPPPMPVVPEAALLRGNTVPGTSMASHIGIGLSESFLNYAGYGLFDSGLLCLGVGTRLSQQLSSGLFSLIGVDLSSLAFPLAAAPMSIALRPQAPPQFVVGNTAGGEPLLTITLPQLAIDFYIWSSERYVRFMTYQANLTIPIGLGIEDGALAPMVGEVTATESTVTNNELVAADPAALAVSLETLIGSFASTLAGSIDPIMLPSIMGFDLQVPEMGVQGFEDSGERFVGVFANLALSSSMIVRSAETHAELEEVVYDPRVVTLEHFGDGQRPYARVLVNAEGAQGVEWEFSHRVNGHTWSAWEEAARHIVVEDPVLLLQARHIVEVRARIKGYPDTVDPTPARVEVIVDALPPEVTAERLDDRVVIRASDYVSPNDRLRFRAIVDGTPTAWAVLGESASVPASAADSVVEVEVEDEAGNVGRARSALIRGLPNPATVSACACTVPGADDGAPPFVPIALGAVVIALFLRRRGDRR